MLKTTALGLSLIAVMITAPAFAQTEPPPPPPAGEAAPPPPVDPKAPPPVPGAEKPMHGPDGMMPPPPPAKTSIKISLGKDQMIDIDCGATDIAACVTATKPLVDHFMK